MNCALCALMAVLPVVEVRGAVPCLALLKCPIEYLLLAYALCTATGIAVYLSLGKLVPLAERLLERRWRPGAELLKKVMERAERGAGEKVEKYGTLGLALFVGIPLPGTGVWTGALAGYLLGLRKRDVIIALALGNALATALMASSYLLSGP
ncbi:MAG: small multi-drug export protein [Crenarchaeota archaeon]|nr:small multi-drug export protein [Thermoproteota archaeon]